MIVCYWNESIKTTQSGGHKIARYYFLVINVSHFSLVVLAYVATAFVHHNTQFQGENTKLYFSWEECKLDKIDAITSN